jgi:hypothetical protein
MEHWVMKSLSDLYLTTIHAGCRLVHDKIDRLADESHRSVRHTELRTAGVKARETHIVVLDLST